MSFLTCTQFIPSNLRNLVVTQAIEIITLIKSKIKLETKNVNSKEAEKIISEFNKFKNDQSDIKKAETSIKNKAKSKKISKK